MACDQTEWTLHEGEIARADVRELLSLHFAEMRGSSPPEACHVLPAEALASPAIRFLTLRDGDGRLLGMGALKQLDAAHGEIKSMRTSSAAAERGVGATMLAHLLSTARAAGMTRVSLETGSAPLFDAANRLYLRAGFERCAPFGDYAESPFTRFYSKLL